MPVAPPRRRALRALAVAVAAMALSGCRADVAVHLELERNGTGEVRVVAVLDRAAAVAVGESQLALDDLRRTGWVLDPPRRRPGGGVELVARQRFRSPLEAERLLGEVTGPAGPLGGVRLRQRRDLLRTTTVFEATVDLRRGLAAFGDEDLTDAFGGEPLGVDLAGLERQLGRPVREAVRVEIAVDLPGREAPDATSGDGTVWRPVLGERMVIAARATAWNVPTLALLAVALVSALAALSVVVVRRQRRLGVTRSS